LRLIVIFSLVLRDACAPAIGEGHFAPAHARVEHRRRADAGVALRWWREDHLSGDPPAEAMLRFSTVAVSIMRANRSNSGFHRVSAVGAFICHDIAAARAAAARSTARWRAVWLRYRLQNG